MLSLAIVRIAIVLHVIKADNVPERLGNVILHGRSVPATKPGVAKQQGVRGVVPECHEAKGDVSRDKPSQGANKERIGDIKRAGGLLVHVQICNYKVHSY